MCMKICDSPRSLKGKVLVAQSCLTFHNQPGSSVHGILQARILEGGSHSLLQEIFLTQGLNPCLLHCRQILPLQASLVVPTVKNLPTMHLPAVQETLVPSLIPWRREWLLTPVFLPGQFHGQRSLARLQTIESQRVGHD